MSKSKTTIVLNGVTYDALSGKLLNQKAAAKKKNKEGGVYLDGFIRVKEAGQPDYNAMKNVKKTVYPSREGVKAVNVHASRAQRTHTLMRRAVRKTQPTSIIAKAIPLHSTTSTKTATSNKHTATGIINHVPKDRLERSNSVQRSKVVQKFSWRINTGLQKTQTVMEVKEPPIMQYTAQNTNTADTNAYAREAQMAANSLSIFDRAIDRAQSHLQLPVAINKQPVFTKYVGTAVVTLLLIALSGIFVYYNATNFALKFASAQAGFEATVPHHRPDGFSLVRPVQYRNNQVMLDFRSNSDSRSFRIIQQPTRWDSAALEANYLKSNKLSYDQLATNGLKVFSYGQNSATWIDRGIWYKLESNAQLSFDQIKSLAASM